MPISDNLSALMALVMADLSEAQRETLMNLIFQRNIELTALTLQQLRDFLITLFHAPKSSLENPSWSQKTGPRSFVSISYGELDQYEGHWVCDEATGEEGFLDEHEDTLWIYDEDQCYWAKYPFQGRTLRKGGKSKGGGKGKQGKNKGKGYQARRFFRPYRKGGGKGKKGGKSSSSTAKANVAEEEVEEEEMEDDALLADKKKRKRRPQGKRKGKAQPAASTAHEAEAALDEDGFAYSAVSYPLEIVSYDQEWCLKGTKGVQEEVEDGTSMILDTGCTKAMCSRHAYLLMRQGLSEDRVELLPDASTFNFANGQKALAREKCRIWFSKHYHMSSAQFRRRTSELYLPEGIYRMYENVVKECEICQKTKPAPPRSRFSGVRAKEFGDVVFMDHCEIKHMTKKHQLFLVLDGATSLLWGATQQEGTEPVTQDLFREWMHVHSCKPRWVVADMAFFTPSWMVFWKTHGVKTMPTGRATPWPNRAETAVRLFKRQYEKLLMEASTHPTLNKVTLRDLIRECCWARNTTLTISGYTPVELATGRRPTDHSDLELMKPDQLSVADLPRDATLNELRKLALKAHLEARQSADLRRDLARRVLPSDGPYAHGDRVFVWIDDKAKYKAVGRWARARVISQNGAIVTVETDKAVLRVNQSKVRRDYDPWHDVPLPRNLDKPEKDAPLEPDDEPENLEEHEGPANQDADYVQDFKAFLAKVRTGTFSALNVSFENSSQILELSSRSCSVTPLLIDYGLDVSNPYDINEVSNVGKLVNKLRKTRPSVVLYNLLGVNKKNMKQVLQDISKELHEYIRDTGFILVVLDSMTLPVLTKKSKHKIKELKNVEEHIFHPGGDSNHYCSMMTNMPRSYATYPLSQTSDRSKNRLAVFAVKLRESMKAYLSDRNDWPTSYYSELLLDTLLEDFTSAEIKDLDVWYGKHEMQEEVYTVSYKITTDDKFLQNMMRSVDALPARTEANLESVNGRSAEFFKTTRRKLIPRLSFETSVIYRGTYGRKIPLSAMDDSCMILWWVKNKRPYQLFVTSSRDFMDVQRRMPASKISMVTFWSGRTSEVAQGGITMRDSATAGLGDQPPAPPRTLEQIPLQELCRPVPEEVLPPVTPPPVPAEQPIEVDDEDMQPPDEPQQSMQPPLTPPRGGLHVPLPDSPM